MSQHNDYNDSPRFFPNPFASEFCEFFKCRTQRCMAKYIIGQPSDSSLVQPGFLRVCEQDAISIVSQLPPELLPYIPELKAMGDQVSALEEQVNALEEQVKDLKEQLKAAHAGLIPPASLAKGDEPQATGFQCPYCDQPPFSAKGPRTNHIKAKHPGKAIPE